MTISRIQSIVLSAWSICCNKLVILDEIYLHISLNAAVLVYLAYVSMTEILDYHSPCQN